MTEDEIVESKAKESDIRAKLEENMKILQALEEEWNAEQAARQQREPGVPVIHEATAGMVCKNG